MATCYVDARSKTGDVTCMIGFKYLFALYVLHIKEGFTST